MTTAAFFACFGSVKLPGILLLSLCLLGGACAPAHLERRYEKALPPATAAGDLARAFAGAQDPAALRRLGDWIREVHRDGRDRAPFEIAEGGTTYRIRFAAARPGIFSPADFDQLEPAAGYEIRGLKHHRSPGAGVCLVGSRANRRRLPVERWYPPENITRAVTAVAVPLSGKHQIEIRLIDRLHEETIELGGRRQPLAADFSVPWVALLERTRPLSASGFTSMIRQHNGREASFALLEEYDPRKTPLICIHGLFSTPLAWAELTNEVWNDPEIRRHYQVWHYLYPTHAPALYSARIMRGQFDELRRFLDPGGRDPAMQRTVVVAHSMGGLLAKTLVVDPRETFWRAAFTRPLASLDVTPAERATLKEAFYWKPRTSVDRVIFCSVPFRGSTFAASWLGRLGNFLTAPSHDFQDFYREVERKNPGMLQPDYRTLTRSKLTSVWALAPKVRSMEILDELPVVPGVHTHVILGSHDHFVSHESGTLAGAESTLEVPSGHGSFHHPLAIAEIKRILKLPPPRPESR